MLKFDLDPDRRYHLASNHQLIGLDSNMEYKQTNHKFVAQRFDRISQQYHPLNVSNLKPVGLWYAFGRDWLDFERQAARGLDDYQLPPLFELELDTKNFVVITSTEEALDFHKTYGTDDPHGIDWAQVIEDYDGIEIRPFDQTCQLFWYQTFDLTSGCIWNLKALHKSHLQILNPYAIQTSSDTIVTSVSYSPIGL